MKSKIDERKFMEEIFKLMDEEQTNSAIELIQEKLKNPAISEDFSEDLINNLNVLNEKSDVIIKTIFPSLLKLIGMDNDVLRYSLVLSLKSLCRSHPDLIIPFAKENLSSENGNSRESMLQLLSFAASSSPELLHSFIEDAIVINMLADKEDFVQKKAVEFLKVLGKKYALDIEKKIIEQIKSSTNQVLKENGEILLKSLVDIQKLETDELEKKELEVKVKVLQDKEKQVTEEEVKIKEEEIRKREEIVNIKKGKEEIDEALINKEKELIEKERILKQKELKLKEAALLVEEKEREIEEEKIRHKAEQLEKEIEITRKRAELDKVKKELAIKELEKETEEIIKEEEERVKKALDKAEDEALEE